MERTGSVGSVCWRRYKRQTRKPSTTLTSNIARSLLIALLKAFMFFSGSYTSDGQNVLSSSYVINTILVRKATEGVIPASNFFAGIIDEKTREMMEAPRCGVPDIVDGETAPPSGQTHRKKRFVLQGSKWKVKDLTWSVSQMTNQLSRTEVESQIAKAWKVSMLLARCVVETTITRQSLHCVCRASIN